MTLNTKMSLSDTTAL